MFDEKILKNEERAIYSLRSLYRKYGYMPFKMSKFEEYDLYVRNKDFLVSDRIITFNDTSGKLLALKPDVTLSVIKNGEDRKLCKQKVFYNENVYRVSGATHQFKEIMQTGLECIGDIGIYDIFETAWLAAQSLELISPRFVLDISHLGILTSLLREATDDEAVIKKLTRCVSEKNGHDLRRICAERGIADEYAERLCTLISVYGSIGSVVPRLEPLCTGEQSRAALSELKELFALFGKTGYGDRVLVDFSVVNDMNYYNGIVMRGFIDGICEGILAGGGYDKMMHRMGRSSGAVGFAIYLDLLEGLGTSENEFDTDTLVLYNDETDTGRLAAEMKRLTEEGRSADAERSVPEKLRYRTVLDLREDGVR